MLSSSLTMPVAGSASLLSCASCCLSGCRAAANACSQRATDSPQSCVQGKRYVLPNTRIMLHHPSGTARGQASDIQNEARELMRIRGYINKVLSEATGKPIEKVNCGFDWMLQMPTGALAIQLALEGRLSDVCSGLSHQSVCSGLSPQSVCSGLSPQSVCSGLSPQSVCSEAVGPCQCTKLWRVRLSRQC